MDFSDRLLMLRKKKRISQVELSEMSGISQQSISSIEKKVNSPTIYTAQKLADALGVSLVELITGNPPAPPVVYSDTPLTETERQLISDFRTLNSQGREIILQQMEMVKKIYGQYSSISVVEDSAGAMNA